MKEKPRENLVKLEHDINTSKMWKKKPYKDSGKFKTNPCKTKTTNLRIKQINFEFSIGKPL